MDVRAHELRYRRADSSRDVVQLCVYEDSHVPRFAIRKNPLRIAVKRFQADFHDDVELVEFIDELLGSFGARHVEGDDQLGHL